ncbi:MAG: hypothetical protein ACN4G0_04230 [Polyangiales bacterium]
MGFMLFSLGRALAIAGLVLAALGYAKGTVAVWVIAMVAGGELMTLLSVSFRRDGGNRGTEASSPASSQRHALGISLLVAHIAAYFLVWTTAILGYSRATDLAPFPSVFGLSFEAQGPALLWGVVGAELLFLLALYVLGSAWWAQFEQLFRYQPPATPADPDPPKPPPTIRYRLGLAVFVIGNLLAVTGMLLPALGFTSGRMVGVIAVILAAGEIISASSIFLLGKEGFKELKTRLFAFIKRAPSGQSISHRRHRFGVTLLALHVLAQFAALLFPVASHFALASDGAFPTVLGLGREEQLKWFLLLLVAGEALFFAGVYTLGADWWGRFRALFRKTL